MRNGNRAPSARGAAARVMNLFRASETLCGIVFLRSPQAMSSSSVRNVSMARGIIKLYRVIASSGQGEGARDMGEVWRDFIQTERGIGGEAAQGVELSGADFQYGEAVWG